MNIRNQLYRFEPFNEQEKNDKEMMLFYLENGIYPFSRDNRMAHFTASSWIINQDHSSVLMVYHNIYRSWSWTGGHADGNTDLYSVALREAREETGIQTLLPLSDDIFSLEIITVDGHEKHGKYVGSHLHMNITYLFEADEKEQLQCKPDENSGVKWIPISELADYVSEPWMLSRIYAKLNLKLQGEYT